MQSDVPEVSELCWLLMTGTPMGLLERCHAYKDKKAKGLTADAGLFTYPVLMAADILIYDSDIVPVGEDQVQHIEVCRDLAASKYVFGGALEKKRIAVVVDAARERPVVGRLDAVRRVARLQVGEPRAVGDDVLERLTSVLSLVG